MTLPIPQAVLGYQMRIPIDSVEALWPLERRIKYLLNQSIKNPLSADSAVWPISRHNSQAHKFLVDYYEGDYSSPNGLSLYDIKRDINDLLNVNNTAIACIGAEKETASHLRSMHAIDIINTKPIGQFFGFDVCDEWLTSGLMNCRVDESQHAILQSKFSNKLNQYGLFEKIEEAAQYSAEISKLVPEHAPFFPISVFVLNTR